MHVHNRQRSLEDVLPKVKAHNDMYGCQITCKPQANWNHGTEKTIRGAIIQAIFALYFQQSF